MPAELGAPQPLEVTGIGSRFFQGRPLVNDRPHPAVARIVVPEGNATSYGSGTLVDARGEFGLVVTNWHVVRDSRGDVEVFFPDGFHCKARPLKVDADWDLAALVIWRPPVKPVPIAAAAPQPGDQLTICGYGSGQYRAATGRCTQYYAPAVNLPEHMVELDVEARQGDSGGPIFNERGELAGVLFGAGRGTTLGSFGGRVGTFLASLAPDIGRPADNALAQDRPAPPLPPSIAATQVAANAMPTNQPAARHDGVKTATSEDKRAALWTEVDEPSASTSSGWHAVSKWSDESTTVAAASVPIVIAWHDPARNILAVVGALALVLQVLRLVR
jgi:hypothetical protein